MLKLCYNAWEPGDVLKSGILWTSVINGHDRGVSMSSNLSLWGHGPFKFVFKEDLHWYKQFTPCQYAAAPIYDPNRRLAGVQGHEFKDTRIYKPHFFAVEEEWWSPEPVRFCLSEVERLVYMANSPGARVYPRKCPRLWQEVQVQFANQIRFEIDLKHYPPQEGQ